MSVVAPMQPKGNPNIPIKIALFEHFREVGFVTPHEKSDCPHDSNRTAVLECRDPSYVWAEAEEARRKHGAEPVPYPFFGGLMRLSPHCPVPYQFYRDEIIPRLYAGQHWSDAQIYRQELACREEKLQALVTGCVIQRHTLLKGGGHAPGCGWARLLNLHLCQQFWLMVDGRNSIKDRSKRGEKSWVENGEFQVYPTVKWHGDDVTDEPETMVISCKHRYLDMYPIQQIMCMSDRELLEQLDPDRLNGI